MNNSSFIKGEKFEKFIENNIFTDEDYDLIHRSNSYEQNKNRFAEETLKPDFKFRCKKTNKEFYIEAKYRSKYNSSKKIEIMSLKQFERFKQIQKNEKIPIYLLIGMGGRPENPNSLSIIPIEKIEFLSLYESFLRKFRIKKTKINSEKLKIDKLRNNIIEKLKEKNNIEDSSKLNRTNKNKYLLVGLIALIISSFFLFTNINANDKHLDLTKAKLKNRIASYYKNLELGNFDNLDEFINPTVKIWFNKTNLTIEEIKKDAKKYQEKYPFTKSTILWNSFKVSKINSDYLTTYKMIYRIKKRNDYRYKIFHLNISSIWNKNLKLISMKEEKYK